MRSALAATALLVGCADPGIDLVLEMPGELRAQIERAAVRVLEPPAGEPFGCEALAYQRVRPEVVRVSEAQQVVLESSEEAAPIRDVDRTVRNVFLVEAFAGEQLVAHACAEQPPFAGDVTVELRGEADTRIELAADPHLDQGTVEATIYDCCGHPIAGSVVEVEQRSSGGVIATARVTSGAGGRIEVPVDPSPLAGPYLVELRSRWSSEAPRSVSGLRLPRPRAARQQGLGLGALVGRFREGRRLGMVGLFSRTGGPVMELFDGSAFDDPSGVLRPIASLAVPDGSAIATLEDPIAGDDVVAISNAGAMPWWVRWNPRTGAADRRTITVPPNARGVRRVLPRGPCGAGAPEVVVVFDNDLWGYYAADGTMLGTEQPASRDQANLLYSGCVADTSGARLRTLVQANSSGGVILLVEDGVSRWSAPWYTLNTGINFAQLGSQPPVLIGTQLVLNEFVVSTARLARQGDSLSVEPLTSARPPQVPLFTAGGDFDGDGRLDVASVVAEPVVEGRPIQYALWASAADGAVAGARRFGADELCGPAVFAGDLDDDGMDDLIVAEILLACLFSPGGFQPRVLYFPMGAAAE